jgi:hypothetical protein
MLLNPSPCQISAPPDMMYSIWRTPESLARLRPSAVFWGENSKEVSLDDNVGRRKGQETQCKKFFPKAA